MGVLRGPVPHGGVWGPPLSFLLAAHAWGSQGVPFPSLPPQLPRAWLLVLISRGQLGSPEHSTEALSQGAWDSL